VGNCLPLTPANYSVREAVNQEWGKPQIRHRKFNFYAPVFIVQSSSFCSESRHAEASRHIEGMGLFDQAKASL
jgi:hypothetical protein